MMDEAYLCEAEIDLDISAGLISEATRSYLCGPEILGIWMSILGWGYLGRQLRATWKKLERIG